MTYLVGRLKIRISVSDESGVDGQSLSGQATDGNGSVQTCSFAENSGQYTCLLTLGNGNYRVVVSTKDPPLVAGQEIRPMWIYLISQSKSTASIKTARKE
jgi:hypothetical protein